MPAKADLRGTAPPHRLSFSPTSLVLSTEEGQETVGPTCVVQAVEVGEPTCLAVSGATDNPGKQVGTQVEDDEGTTLTQVLGLSIQIHSARCCSSSPV